MRYHKDSLNRIADRRIIAFVAGLCLAIGVVPLVATAVLSFCSIHSNSFHFGSLDGYRALVAGGRLKEFGHIVFRSASVTLLTMLISVPTAYWMSGIRRKGAGLVVLALLVAPWLVSDMLRAFGWQLILSPTGLISLVWNFITRSGPLEGLRYNSGAVVLALTSSMLPAGVLSVLAAIPQRASNEWLAAAELGHPRHVFNLMAIRRAALGIALGACLVFVLSTFSSAEPRFLDGPTQTSIQTISASLANESVPAVFALGTVSILFAICACVIASMVYYVFTYPRIHSPGSSQNSPSRMSLGGGGLRRLIASIIGALLDHLVRKAPAVAAMISITLCSLPILAVIAQAFSQPTAAGTLWTFQNFHFMVSSGPITEAFVNSIVVAAIVAVISGIFAFVLSLVVWDQVLHRWLLFALAALILLPGESYAFSVAQILRFFGHSEGGWALVVASHVIWAVPFTTGTLILANRQLGENFLRASLEYGNRPLEVITRLVGRINFGQVVGVALLAATLSLNDYVRSSYLGAALVTVSNEVHGRLNAGLLPENRGVFAAEFIIFAVSMATVLILSKLLRVKRDAPVAL